MKSPVKSHSIYISRGALYKYFRLYLPDAHVLPPSQKISPPTFSRLYLYRDSRELLMPDIHTYIHTHIRVCRAGAGACLCRRSRRVLKKLTINTSSSFPIALYIYPICFHRLPCRALLRQQTAVLVDGFGVWGEN